MKKKKCQKQAIQIYLHLMVMLRQWLPTKEQHYCQKLNAGLMGHSWLISADFTSP